MAVGTMRKVVRLLPRGQVTIPAAMRQALGLTDSSLLEVSLEGERIVISNLEVAPGRSFRVYSDSEITEFLEEDKISPEAAKRVRKLMQAGLV